MRKLIISLFALFALMANAQNPLTSEFQTPYGTPPFSQINDSQWEEAIDEALVNARAEINDIVIFSATPDFENTIAALDYVGKDLNRVLGGFYALLSANSTDEMMEISIRVSPKLSEYSTSIVLNDRLWKRIKYVYDNRENEELTTEQLSLLQKTYDSFALSGANLQGEDRETYRKLSAELSELTTIFSQNVLKEMSTYEFWVTADDLAGLSDRSIANAAAAAEAKGRKGEYMFTLDFPTYSDFMKYSSRRDLREKMWRIYNSRNTKGEYSNVEILKRIAEVRSQIANLLGAPTHAAHSLQRTMAGTPENVYNLLNSLRDAYTAPLKAEMKEIAKFASKLEGKKMEILPWDYSYYSNKLKAEKYSFDEEAIRPYFELNNVIEGVFGLATKLYGLQFKENKEIDVYHPDVKAFEVRDANSKLIGLLYTDFFPRASKRPGAWMTSFRDQMIDYNTGGNVMPLVTIVMNFSKPVGETPALLTPSEVETFLHEFGHALHGLLSKVTYPSLSGTSVYRDFVELPSQFNENYLYEREFLDSFARHYQTGESIPQEYIDRLIASAQFGAAYACMRQLSFGYLDMAWHTITSPVKDVEAFENEAINPVRIFAPVEGSFISTTFSHIFSGGYAAGYYSYKWAEVLDADAFALFKQNGIFDKATAESFRKNILERGGTEGPEVLYRRFRGQDASIDALLKRDGIKK